MKVIHALSVATLWPILTAGSCATTREPEVRTVEVRVAVPVPCVPKSLAAAPAYPDTDDAVRASAGPGDLLHLLAAGRLLRIQRSAEVEPVIKACRPPDPG